MRTIHKYVILGSGHAIKAPTNFRPVYFGRQGTDYCVWAEVDTSLPLRFFNIRIHGTGNHIPDGQYIGSVIADPYVWHAYWSPA